MLVRQAHFAQYKGEHKNNEGTGGWGGGQTPLEEQINSYFSYFPLLLIFNLISPLYTLNSPDFLISVITLSDHKLQWSKLISWQEVS